MTTATRDHTVLVFRPRPSLGWLWLGLIGLAVAGLGLTTLLGPSARMSSPLLLINLALPLGIGLPMLVLAAWFPTMRYEVDGRTLALRYGPMLHYRIPLAEITSVRRRDLAISLWSSLRLPGLALFSVPYSDVGTVKMCATAASRGILLIETTRGKYGLTPADEAAFVEALRARLEG